MLNLQIGADQAKAKPYSVLVAHHLRDIDLRRSPLDPQRIDVDRLRPAGLAASFDPTGVDAAFFLLASNMRVAKLV